MTGRMSPTRFATSKSLRRIDIRNILDRVCVPPMIVGDSRPYRRRTDPQNKSPALAAGLSSILLAGLLESGYVAGLRPFLAFYNLELNVIAFLQALIAF
jgi:hypothetical protein